MLVNNLIYAIYRCTKSNIYNANNTYYLYNLFYCASYCIFINIYKNEISLDHLAVMRNIFKTYYS